MTGDTRRRPTPDDKDDMRRLRAKGLGVKAIGAKLGFSKSAVHRAVKDMEVDARITANRQRAEIPPAWLSPARRLLRKGMTRYEASRELKIPIATFYRGVARWQKRGIDT